LALPARILKWHLVKIKEGIGPFRSTLNVCVSLKMHPLVAVHNLNIALEPEMEFWR
jgi:hypothetical protein